MQLTALERGILNHRLEVPESITEALGWEIGTPEHEEYLPIVSAVCDGLKIDIEKTIAKYTTMAKLVIEDAVSGSTYFGAAKDNVSPQKQAAIARAGDSLAEKVSKIIGREVEYPHY